MTSPQGFTPEAHAEIQPISVRGYSVEIRSKAELSDRKASEQRSSQVQRDQGPALRSYSEPQGLPYLRSGSISWDALFALAMQESREAAVEAIRDGSFDNNQPLQCSCFETGALWHYVWTRDSSYAVDLGLGWLDPLRSKNTLLFKLSKLRQASTVPLFGSGLEIVQDTGTGGSWPISSDRVVWALGADRLLPLLPASEQSGFLQKAFEALVNTLETDRLAVFDEQTGLYRGEQSFLDWREQSYPSWTQTDVRAIGLSHALSTNVLHLLALRKAASFAEQLGQPVLHDRYSRWALDLAPRIRNFFWLPERSLLSSMSASQPAFALEKFDLLGISLAVLAKVVSAEEGRLIFSQYPIYRAGPPVIHPQQPNTAIYHNRAVWPFVTAYAWKAAALVQHAPFATEAAQSLFDGAALNLSHMENLEFLSGRPFVADGSLSGPVVNSRRQLWSVAAFSSLIIDGIFGLEAKSQGLSLEPKLTSAIARRWFPGRNLELHELNYQGHSISIYVQWPELSGSNDQFLSLASLELNGQDFLGKMIRPADLHDINRINISLQANPSAMILAVTKPSMSEGPNLNNKEYKTAFAPLEPQLSFTGPATVRIERRESNPTRWDLYRNGQRIAHQLEQNEYTDPLPLPSQFRACYMAIQSYSDGILSSHPSPPLCREGYSQEWTAANRQLVSPDAASLANDHGRAHFNDWGYPAQVLEVNDFTAAQSGAFGLEVAFANAFGPINTGITASVKKLRIIDQHDQTEQSGVIWMAQQSNWDVWSWSSPLTIKLTAGHRYRIRLEDFKNMSSLEHFFRYTGGRGGQDGVINRANISGIRLYGQVNEGP